MLSQLFVRDFVIVERLSLDLAAGMTALTGETGAGKSILFDAIGLALGDRGDAGWIRSGAERAEICLTFDIETNGPAKTWLADSGFGDDQCLLRRSIGLDGRSKTFINDQPVSLQKLRELRPLLVEIHGQHAHQALLRTDRQRDVLDGFAKHPELVTQVAQAYRDWQNLLREREQHQLQAEQRQARRELLQYQVEELALLGLKAGEIAELEHEHQRLFHAQDLQGQCQQSLTWLYDADNRSAASLLHAAQSRLQQAAQLDSALQPQLELLESAAIQIQEAASDLRRYLDAIELDPARLDAIDQRLADLQQLARKHRVEPESLPEHADQLARELLSLEAAADDLAQMDQAIQAAEHHYQQRAQRLSQSRQQAAARLGPRITEVIHQLSMPDGEVQIQVSFNLDQAQPSGADRVEFLVATNKGQELASLSRVVSGGELSRISLAILVITSGRGEPPTLLFDEVDVGIGGKTARVVGKHLRELAQWSQIFCVTHLPQVASYAQQQLLVTKDSDGAQTRGQIEPLSAAQRIEEIARMLGGDAESSQSLAHARELLIAAGAE